MAQLNLSGLSSILTSISSVPGGLSILGSHLSQSQEVQAIQVLDSMAANPATAAQFLPQLSAIQNVPTSVINDVDAALANAQNPQQFQNYILQAKNALVAAVSTGVLGALGL